MLYLGSALHDMIFVVAAAVICLFSSWATFYSIVKDDPGPRRTISIIVLAGLGVWTTHYVAILGLRPDFRIAFSIPETMGSLVLSIAVIGGGIAMAAVSRRLTTALIFAACAGAGISGIHHLGMFGLSGCIVHFDTFSVIASTLASMGFSVFALAVLRSSFHYKVLIASLLFFAASIALHFGSMFGTSLQVGGVSPWVISEFLLTACQFVAVLALVLPVSRTIRQHMAHSKEAALSRQVAMATDEGVVTMGADGRLTWASDAFLRLTGLNRKEIQNVNSVKIVERFASPEDTETYRHAIKTGAKAVIDLCVERRGPRQQWQRVRLIPKHSEDGVLVGFVSAHQDISTEKAALERSKASETEANLLAIVAEHATDAILITDARGGTLWVNASFQRLSGYTLDEMLGRKPGEVLQCTETNPSTVRAISRALRDARPIRTEIMNANKDGDTYWTELEISPVKRDGDPLRFIAVSRDVSERIERERHLNEARRKAEAADQMKSDFLARMSHEIRTPMNGVTGLTEVLSTTDLSEDQEKYVAHIRECSAQLLRVVNDVLDFSSIAKGEISLKTTAFDIREVAEEALSMVRLAAKERDLKLQLDFSDAPSGRLLGDKDRLKQVLLNLLSNAVKFTEAGSVTLQISDDVEGCADTTDGVRLKFAVIDTGVGIPRKMQEHVFEPFRQVEESATRSYEGTGLGLAIAKDIVIAMGGRLTLESEVGKGSTFAFSLQFETAAETYSKTVAA